MHKEPVVFAFGKERPQWFKFVILAPCGYGIVKWGDIEQFSRFFLNKIDDHNHMAPILQT